MELANLPYLTHAESFKDGLLIQVGESYEESATEAGQRQLLNATKAWKDLVESKGLYDSGWWKKDKESQARLDRI